MSYRCMAALLLFGCVVGRPGTANEVQAEDTVDICTELVETINHPAKYVAEKIQRGCHALAPHCCGPTWQTHPECYVINNKTIEEGWSETVKKTKCDRMALEIGFREFMTRRLDPRLRIPEVQLLMNYVEIQTAAYLRDAKPLPSHVVDRLKKPFQIGGFPFPVNVRFQPQDVDNARFIPYTGLTPNMLSPKTYGQSQDSITWGNLIVAGPGLLAASGCREIAAWAHELVHVRQYRDQGFYSFQLGYLSDPAKYEDKAAEREAYAVDSDVMDACKSEGRSVTTSATVRSDAAGLPVVPGAPSDVSSGELLRKVEKEFSLERALKDAAGPSSIFGRVFETRDGSETPLAGASVSIYRIGGTTLTEPLCRITTDEQGTYACDDLPPGRYRVEAAGEGLGRRSTYVTLPLEFDQFPLGVTVVLSRASP